MCGIAGYVGPEVPGLLSRMVEYIRRRGPDDKGCWRSGDIHFGHTRLSIVDLANGQQPMLRGDGQTAVTYNGEIYNYERLRPEIEAAGGQFETTCDTELLPLGHRAFGLDLLPRLNGIFAFALADLATGEVHLVRDPFGIKPLYYAVAGETLVFASSARTVALHPAVNRRLDTAAARDLLQFRYVPDGRPLFEGFNALPPGHIATWLNGRLDVRAYWQPPPRKPLEGRPDAEWVERLTDTLSESVRQQLRSDVPVGILLSGGIDSTAITHFATRQGSSPLTAFTIAVGENVDESAQAREVAHRYGLRHEVVSLPDDDDLSGLYQAVASMDVPVGDAIVLPTYRLCEAVGCTHKVVLTGEGADELFGGYVHYPVLRRLDRLSRTVPNLRHFAPLLNLVPVSLLNALFSYQASLGRIGRAKLARLFGALDRRAALPRMVTTVLDDEEVAEATNLPPLEEAGGEANLSENGILLDGLTHWLPNQILNKMDQLSMAHGVEARVPFPGHASLGSAGRGADWPDARWR